MDQVTTTATLSKVIPAGRPGVPNPIDIHVGRRIRERRIILGMSQQKLGDSLGLTFQQVQKYERGTNRVGASRLWDLANVLDVPLVFFYENMPSDVSGNSPRLRAGVTGAATPEVEFEADPMVKRETLELARAYYKIKDPSVRKQVFNLVKAQANSGAAG